MMPKHLFANLIIAAALLPALTGCAQSAAPPLPPTPAPPFVRVAILTATQGEQATFGRLLQNGIVLAFEEWNRQNPDRPVAWHAFNTGCQFDSGQVAARQALAQGYRLMIGPLCSEAAIAAAQEAEVAQALLIAPTATHPLVTVNAAGQTRPTVFRVSHAFPAQGQAAALFAARTLGASTAAILTRPTDEYSAALAAAFAAAFSRQGGQIVHQAHFMANPPALADTLRAIQKSGAAVLYLPVSANAANAVAAALASPALGPPPALIGSDLWESPELNRAALENACFTTAAALPAGQPWVDLYKSTYALDPDPLATLGYQAAQLLLAAVQQTGADNPLTLTRALEQGHSNAFHNPLTPVPVNRISGGQIVPAGTIEINLQPE